MRLLYILGVYLAAPLISAMLLWRGRRDRGYRDNFRERFGFVPRV
ncbi:MAG: 3-deoxy-D-manno-octulosonic acid transferase, partial [Gammaproteobacteria bacterium]|nr:3-deoxy-D-manno-octulosonic acid transferase [Gammaproteobacteria bacterium]